MPPEYRSDPLINIDLEDIKKYNSLPNYNELNSDDIINKKQERNRFIITLILTIVCITLLIAFLASFAICYNVKSNLLNIYCNNTIIYWIIDFLLSIFIAYLINRCKCKKKI